MKPSASAGPAFLHRCRRAGEPINLDIGTPPVVVVKHSLAQRSSRLVRFYDAGIIGLGYDGMVKMRDDEAGQPAAKANCGEAHRQREPGPQFADLRPRRSARRQGLRTGGARGWVKRWKEQFHSGWWIEDAQGKWSLKP